MGPFLMNHDYGIVYTSAILLDRQSRPAIEPSEVRTSPVRGVNGGGLANHGPP